MVSSSGDGKLKWVTIIWLLLVRIEADEMGISTAKASQNHYVFMKQIALTVQTGKRIANNLLTWILGKGWDLKHGLGQCYFCNSELW